MGSSLEEDYIEDRTRLWRRRICDVIVPEGHVYVLGDHRNNSSDSRVFGPVPVDNIVGKAWLSYWPADDIGFVPHESYAEDGPEHGVRSGFAASDGMEAPARVATWHVSRRSMPIGPAPNGGCKIAAGPAARRGGPPR